MAEVSHPTHCTPPRAIQFITWLDLSWRQWDQWYYSYSSRSIICQRQQYGQRDPLSELVQLTISGRRIEHSQGVQKARSDWWLVCWDTTNSTRDPLPEVAWQSILVWEHGKGEKHDDNLYACSSTNQSNHLLHRCLWVIHSTVQIWALPSGFTPELSCVLLINTCGGWFIYYMYQPI